MCMKESKRYGIGSLSLLLGIMAILWCCNIQWWDGFCLGDCVLRMLGLPAWSNGDSGVHFTVFYGLIFTVPAWLLARRYLNDKFAVAGRNIAVVLTFALLLAPIFMVV